MNLDENSQVPSVELLTEDILVNDDLGCCGDVTEIDQERMFELLEKILKKLELSKHHHEIAVLSFHYIIQYSISKDLAKVFLRTLSLRNSPKIVTYDYPIVIASQLRTINEHDRKLVKDCGKMSTVPATFSIETILELFLSEETDSGEEWQNFVQRMKLTIETVFWKDIAYESESSHLKSTLEKKKICSVLGLTYLIRFLHDTNTKFQRRGEGISNLRWYTCVNELAFYLEKLVNKFYSASTYYIGNF
ncbi:DgyrCDS11939 [Dimorphilus gyrociliatus]|uniref:DgyrCDS11939 n=1 Tax=Dimorphilus gyrociliatus TaxID=2664684 RepID=A0A7I8W682_9ANNE|nr:DgyrCDS11939 [Dimorphilus gyrociliatus]